MSQKKAAAEEVILTGTRASTGPHTDDKYPKGLEDQVGPSPSSDLSQATVIVAVIILAAFWGLAFVWIKIALKDLPPLELTIWRFVVASVLFIPILIIKRGEVAKITKVDIPAIAGIGFVGMAGYHFLLNWGEQYTYSGTASLIIATSPVLVLVGSTFLLGERLTSRKVIGICLALAGVASLSYQGGFISGEGTQTVLGILAILGSALTAAVFTIGGKKYIDRIDPLVFISLGTLVSLVALLPILAVTGVTSPREVSLVSWGSVIALGVLSTVVSYGLFFTILKYREASKTSMYVYLVPLFALSSGMVILGEKISMFTVIGGGLILSGVWVVTRRGANQKSDVRM